MAKKVFIGVGHGGSDGGAAKYIVEKEYTLLVAKALADYLRSAGVESKLSRTADIDTDLSDKVKMCNTYNPDLVVDIHFNAGGGTGFEVYRSIVGGTSTTLANNINAEVKKIISSRGVKTKIGDGNADYFGIIRDTNAPAVLCEGGFVDTKSDADFIKVNYKKLAKAYCDGILKTLGIKTAVKSATVSAKVLDKTGYKNGDGTIGSLALKEMLITAKEKGIITQGMDENEFVGSGTIKAINALLKKWGYSQNGIAGESFIKKLGAELRK